MGAQKEALFPGRIGEGFLEEMAFKVDRTEDGVDVNYKECGTA